MEKQYLVLDPGHSMGYCIFNENNKKMTIISHGFYDIDTSSEYMGDWCIDLQNWIEKKIKTFNISAIIREDYFFSGRFRNGSSVNYAYRTAMDITARQHDLPYYVVGPSIWKKFLCGRSTPTKEQIRIWGKANAKKYMSQAALWTKYKIKFPSHCISEKTNRVIKFRHDTIDAVGIAIYFARIILNMDTVVSTVTSNYELTGSGKVFSYNNIVGINDRYKSKTKNGCIYVFKSGKREGETCSVIPRNQAFPILCAAHKASTKYKLTKEEPIERKTGRKIIRKIVRKITLVEA